MKKTVLTALACLAAIAGVSAQTTIKPRVEAGLNFGNISTSPSTDMYKIALGLRAGAAVEIGLSESPLTQVYLAPGLTYKNHGTKIQNPVGSLGNILGIDLGSLGQDVRLSMHSLAVPVNLGLRANLANDLGLSLEFGPYFSYLLSAKSGDTTITDAYKRFDAGINGSVALEYQRYFLRLGAEYGLTNLSKSSVDALKERNVGFFTTVGMSF